MKGLFFCILLVGFSTNVSGQNFKSSAILGISTSQVSGDQLGGFHKVGLKLGLAVNHSINKATKGQFELYYIDKGSNDQNSNYQIDLSYVESSWSVQKTSQGFIYELGLLVGVLIDGVTYNLYGYDDGQYNDFNRLDIGAKLAAGIHISSNLLMFWELSNTIPFFPIQEHASGLTDGLNKGKNNGVFSISFRYLFSNE
jgi:hypothetical protein